MMQLCLIMQVRFGLNKGNSSFFLPYTHNRDFFGSLGFCFVCVCVCVCVFWLKKHDIYLFI